jgi:uncharacterized protein (TIGR02117 family)
VVAACVVLATATCLIRRPGNSELFPPKPGEPSVQVHVVAYAYHSGLVVPVPALKQAAERIRRGEAEAIADRFGAYPFVEIGWGDEGFYRLVPTLAALTVREALRALFSPANPSVLHVVGFGRPLVAAQGVDVTTVDLSERGFDRLVALAGSVQAVDGHPIELGPGLYGPSLFYRGRGSFNIFNVCNHWVARLLNAAGLPTRPIMDTLPAGLIFDLGGQVNGRVQGADR